MPPVGLDPAAIVIVATARALKMHGGYCPCGSENTDVDALKKGLANLDAHLDAAAHYKRPLWSPSTNSFDDSREELDAIVKHCAERGIPCAIADIFSQGRRRQRPGPNGVEAADRSSAPFKPLYESALPVEEKLNIIARNILQGGQCGIDGRRQKKLAQFEASRLTDLPVCYGKNPELPFRQRTPPRTPHRLPPSPCATLEIANGAGFLVALCGKSCACPPFPSHRTPCIYLDDKGQRQGL